MLKSSDMGKKFHIILLMGIMLQLSVASLFAFERAELLSTPVVRYSNFDKETQRAIYDVDFIFKKCPEFYVFYYSPTEKKMALDFYNATVSWADTVMPNTFNGELSIRNVETTMTLSGKKGQILFTNTPEWDFNQDWYYESSVISETTLRVRMWKQLKPALKVKPQRAKTSTDSAEIN